MNARDIFTLDNSIAPRLIRILYVIALVLITICVIAGVARGIATMVRPPQQRVVMMRPAPPPIPAPATPATPAPAADAAAPAQPAAPAAPATAPAQQAAPQMGPGMMGPGMMEQRGDRMMRRAFRGDGMMGQRFAERAGRRGGQAPVLVGTLRIIGTLLGGLIAFMVIRVLAETANAILEMGAKAKESQPG